MKRPFSEEVYRRARMRKRRDIHKHVKEDHNPGKWLCKILTEIDPCKVLTKTTNIQIKGLYDAQTYAACISYRSPTIQDMTLTQ